ncbi:DUF4326 domain-containing protein [Mesorhizobium sp. M7A.F.Ca.CA.002.12.1.1]|uniref:DUF4326 domain-containing protein n=1 Tax=Mesorhizobium sp. M7A.F.Ca.CA.002.12.1.1 TaxID=2496735 RepID=UPI000FCB9FAF|nr:DUF4326 domain-containing protein [Mesorhizobium sp. M7A.F.Ca.CA.002.12.1.1]RUX60130.1 DUF4326 domain-containing protein [Mesorhizobium sp. M7A.F.Ca.CA.002.12.1.1]
MSIVGIKATHVLFDEIGPSIDGPKVHNKHHRTAPADAVYIGRGSKWGNPFVIGQDGTREGVIKLYELHCLPGLDVSELKGKHLVCFCKPAACHGDLLLKKANA